MIDGAKPFREFIAEYDRIVADHKFLCEKIHQMAEALGFNGGAIPQYYMPKAGCSMADIILAILKDANINAYDLAAQKSNDPDQ